MDAALSWFFLLQGEPDSHELRSRFEEWRDANPAHCRAFDKVAAGWALPETDEVAHRIAAARGFGNAAQAANVVEFRQPKRRWIRWVGAAAAAIVVAIGVQQYPGLRVQWEADYVTIAGGREEVLLPDGSKVTLNTDTAIALEFEGNRRGVRLLRGEAYFDVVHDVSRPFEVTAAFSEVEVKGTAFSVRRDDNQDSVALERGHVEVRNLADPGKRADLQPGQAVVASATGISPVHATDVSVTFAWLKGQITFEDQPFGAVIHELARYYGHTIIRTDDDLDAVKVNGRYRLDNPERAIRSLAATVGATVTRLPGGVLILR
ncbi:FecR domain-containing protein [Rhizobium sp. RM]|nr:FecR domain-containing protein [Rhizobium sp. RM]NWJ23934.1 FecR domain-containing protein [Rhizobium sp. RM]